LGLSLGQCPRRSQETVWSHEIGVVGQILAKS